MKNYQNRQGQQLIEYMLVVTAVVVIMLIFLGPLGPMKRAINDSLDASVNYLERVSRNVVFNTDQ
ncbi:MAG: hypothetical protein A2Z88_04160 [Omnitrophica WOR_2 bacterium GWA2_47_8]|nr:MAG: hypothetical protein A2Z88_04160 [Omnitrophica WOR_2 bacterium GWA2_47_8]